MRFVEVDQFISQDLTYWELRIYKRYFRSLLLIVWVLDHSQTTFPFVGIPKQN